MTDLATAPAIPLTEEIARRLRPLAPTRLDVTNDSARHHGHLGDDGSGESHFTVAIEADAFTGLSRIQRQRLINHALADLLRDRIHALAIRATAPGDAS